MAITYDTLARDQYEPVLQLLLIMWESPLMGMQMAFAAARGLPQGLNYAGAQAVLTGVQNGHADLIAKQTCALVDLGYTDLILRLKQIIVCLTRLGRADVIAKVVIEGALRDGYEQLRLLTVLLAETNFVEARQISEEFVMQGVARGHDAQVARLTILLVQADQARLVAHTVAGLVKQGYADAVAKVSIAAMQQGNVAEMTQITGALVSEGFPGEAADVSGALAAEGYSQFAGKAAKLVDRVGKAIGDLVTPGEPSQAPAADAGPQALEAWETDFDSVRGDGDFAKAAA